MRCAWLEHRFDKKNPTCLCGSAVVLVKREHGTPVQAAVTSNGKFWPWGLACLDNAYIPDNAL